MAHATTPNRSKLITTLSSPYRPQKFTKWADKGTSVNPFLPPRPPASSSSATAKSLPGKALGFLGGLALIVLRLPLLVSALGFLSLAALLSHPLANLTGGLGADDCGLIMIGSATMKWITDDRPTIPEFRITALLAYANLQKHPDLQQPGALGAGMGLLMVRVNAHTYIMHIRNPSIFHAYTKPLQIFIFKRQLLAAPVRRVVAAVLLRPALGFLQRVLGLAFVEQHANLRKLGLRCVA